MFKGGYAAVSRKIKSKKGKPKFVGGRKTRRHVHTKSCKHRCKTRKHH